MNPTTKQIEALRNFKVPEDKIQALNIGQASEMLAGLVKHARERKKDAQPAKRPDPYMEAKTTLVEASEIVMEHFGLRDMSEMREPHIALMQETSRQLYGLKYWIEKSNTKLD